MNLQSFNILILWSSQSVLLNCCVDPQILKYAALPAAVVAVGLSSFRIYSINEKINEELISPRELSIYSPDGPAVRFVEEQPGVVQTGLGAVRVGLQPYVRAVQNTFTSVKVGVISVYHAGQDSYQFLRDPPPGFLPRVGVIGVSGLGGLILARKGSRLKKIFVPLGLATAGTAVCYPTQTVGVLKITGKKVYTVSSSVASMFKSKPKEDVTIISTFHFFPMLKSTPSLSILVKSRFVPDPSLLDHGQSNPEDADMYSTRS
uniref:MICOS complex subunit n=1 Tax=Cyprinus carpio carpio TaxID=630221 RepID=A0A9J7YW76_CYPCA